MKSEKYNDRFKDAADNAARSSAAYEAKGRTRGVAGSVKANVGCLIDDEALEAEGHRQNAEGGKDRVKGEIKEAIEEVKDGLHTGVEHIKGKLRESRNR